MATDRARKFFEKLGDLIKQRWRRKNCDDAHFSEIALGALRKMPPAGQLEESDLVGWLLSAQNLPRQELGTQPPFTLYHHPLFKVGAFFWLHDEHTPIHQHCVSGALHQFSGATLHFLYRFKQRERINSRLLIGDLTLRSAECLQPGDSRAIEHGSRTIHATFHLHRPTVTIVIQTHLDKETLPQYSYLKPSLAYDPVAENALLTRQLELLKVLREAGNTAAYRHFKERISRADFEETFLLLRDGQIFLRPDHLQRLLAVARKRHGRRADLFGPVFEEMRRREMITTRSHFAAKPEHALLLGLLLHLPDRQSICDFIARHVGRDPVRTIVAWVREMAAETPNALGIRFDDLSIEVFQLLLRGASFREVLRQLKKRYPATAVEAEEAQLRELCGAFAESALFKPLFRRPAKMRAGVATA